MTMKEFMTAVIAANLSDDMTAFAKDAITKIDNKNTKRRTTMTAAQKENAALLETIISGMTAGQTVISAEIAKKMGITSQKATALLQNGVKSGALTVTDVKVKGKGKVKGYTLTENADDSADSDPADDEVQALPHELAV